MRKKDLKAIEDYLARERGRDVGVPASPALFLPAATVVNSTGRLTSSLINRLWNEACGLPTSAARPRLLPVMPWVGNMKKTGQPRPCLAIIRRPDLFLGQGQATATSA